MRWTAAVLLAAACSGGSETTATPEPEAPSVAVSAELLAQSWPMQMNDEALLASYAGKPGWISLVTRGDLRAAVDELGPEGGLAAARAHAEAAVMFKQAALLSATAAQQTYGGSARDTDPLGAQHLIMVGEALNGDRAAARAIAEASVQAMGEGQAFHDPWVAWLTSDAAFPPDFSGLDLGLPEVAVGAWPTLSTEPHYQLAERVEGSSNLDVTDPSALVALALWHDAAARTAAGDSAAAVDLFGARYRFPIEAAPPATGELPMEFVFGSDFLVPADASFLAALTGETGAAAVEQYAETSLLASLAVACREGEALSVDKAQDAAALVRDDLLEGMKEAADGNTLGHHRVFADIASVGVLRAMALVAEAEGNRESAGILLIGAMERSSSQHTADPEALLYLSTWDAHNRYPVRGTEILHNLIRRYPNLEAARFGLEVLTLRESRSRGSQNPGL